MTDDEYREVGDDLDRVLAKFSATQSYPTVTDLRIRSIIEVAKSEVESRLKKGRTAPYDRYGIEIDETPELRSA